MSMPDRDTYIGKHIGNYKVMTAIACGTFACAYVAQHVYLDWLAAIKLLRTLHLNSPQGRKKLLEEARLLSTLRHPHILCIYDFGMHEASPYMVTEYAPNGSLQDLIRSYSPHPLPLEQAIQIIVQLGEAISYTHEHGVIHRDIKPGNVLLNTAGKVLLCDFNSAIVHNTPGARHTTSPHGTPPYMAPEQFRGIVSEASDQYSLGCIAYELVTGRKPFMASDPAAFKRKHTEEKPIPPAQLNRLVPLYVEQAIMRALEKRGINRHSDILTFIAELQP